MGNCKCKTCPHIVSQVVKDMTNRPCHDICVNPICGDPSVLSIMAPLIYDEIGINLCASFALGVDISTTYPSATKANIQVINATYTYGDGNVEIQPISGRPNCYSVTLANITIQFVMNLYDDCGRLVGTIYPTAVYLPPTTGATYDEDTNPSSVVLELFAPYGLSYTIPTAGTPTSVLNYIGFSGDNTVVRQGINMYSYAKLLDFDVNDDTATVGLTLVLQSLYFTGYKVKSEGKIKTPKGSIITPENSECMQFVEGELLNLEIKPLDLGAPCYEERLKKSCKDSCSCGQLTDANGIDLTTTEEEPES